MGIGQSVRAGARISPATTTIRNTTIIKDSFNSGTGMNYGSYNTGVPTYTANYGACYDNSANQGSFWGGFAGGLLSGLSSLFGGKKSEAPAETTGSKTKTTEPEVNPEKEETSSKSANTFSASVTSNLGTVKTTDESMENSIKATILEFYKSNGADIDSATADKIAAQLNPNNDAATSINLPSTITIDGVEYKTITHKEGEEDSSINMLQGIEVIAENISATTTMEINGKEEVKEHANLKAANEYMMAKFETQYPDFNFEIDKTPNEGSQSYYTEEKGVNKYFATAKDGTKLSAENPRDLLAQIKSFNTGDE